MFIGMHLFAGKEQGGLLAAILLGGLLYVAGQYVASQPQRVQQETEASRELTVQGTGEIEARPDVAMLTLGVQSGIQASADVALSVLTRRFTGVVQAVRDQGVAEEDIKTTSLSINPVYDFSDGRQQLRGFEATESIEVKIRKLDTIGAVLARATAEGVNQAGGITFAVDDPEGLRIEAQEAAIRDARQKAEQLARALGVRLGRVKTFSADSGGVEPPIFAEARAVAVGVGGDVPSAPPVPVGSQEIRATATVVFELR